MNTEPIAMYKDHVNMVKFASQKDEGYNTMLGHLLSMADKAPGAISARLDG